VTDGAFRHWVPEGAAAPAALRSAIADMTAAWSAKWFADMTFHVTRPLERRPRIRLRPALVWQSNEGGIALGWADHTPESVASRVIGLAAVPDHRGAHDGALLDSVAQECLGDFRRRCCALAKLPSDAAWSGAPLLDADGYELEIGAGDDGPCIVVAVTAACFARLVRQYLPPASPAPMGDARPALQALPVTLSAFVGGCRVSLAELEQLATGDVLILDRAASEAMPLAIDGRVAPRGRCVVAPLESGMGLQITDSLMG
jgi:hypothetical protein